MKIIVGEIPPEGGANPYISHRLIHFWKKMIYEEGLVREHV